MFTLDLVVVVAVADEVCAVNAEWEFDDIFYWGC
jgi:hypothetical protein